MKRGGSFENPGVGDIIGAGELRRANSTGSGKPVNFETGVQKRGFCLSFHEGVL